MDITRRHFLTALGSGLLVAAAEPVRRFWQVGRNAPVGAKLTWLCNPADGAQWAPPPYGLLEPARSTRAWLRSGHSLTAYTDPREAYRDSGPGDTVIVVPHYAEDTHEYRAVSVDQVRLHESLGWTMVATEPTEQPLADQLGDFARWVARA